MLKRHLRLRWPSKKVIWGISLNQLQSWPSPALLSFLLTVLSSQTAHTNSRLSGAQTCVSLLEDPIQNSLSQSKNHLFCSPSQRAGSGHQAMLKACLAREGKCVMVQAGWSGRNNCQIFICTWKPLCISLRSLCCWVCSPQLFHCWMLY